jgi:hypothetical protein
MQRDQQRFAMPDRGFDEELDLDRPVDELQAFDQPGMDDGTDSGEYRGHKVVSERGDKIGTVTDVIYDPMTNRPAWIVVDTGLLHADHYMPIEGTYRSVEGELVGPFDKWTVTHAAKAHKNHVMTRDLEQELCDHYGVNAAN